MKRAICFILTALMLCACLPIMAYAEDEVINYALTATYTAESSVGESIYGLKQPEGVDANGNPNVDPVTKQPPLNPGAPRGNDSEHTRLNDGFTGYDECTGMALAYYNGEKDDANKVIIQTEDTSVCYTGTNSEITLIWDLGSVKNDIAKIGFLNTRSQFEWAEDNQFEDFLDGVYDAWSRSFPLDNINLWIAGEDGKYTRLKQKDAWTYEVIGLDNPYTDVVESDLKDCEQRNVFMVFNKSLVARYIKIGLSPKRYVMSFDELQILGGGEPGEMPTAAPTTTAAATSTAANTTVAVTDANTTAAKTEAITTTQAAKGDTTKANTPATTKAVVKPTEKAESSGGSNLGLIIGIVAGVVVVAAIVVFVIKKKK